jgi:hypothetical protein
MKGGRLFGISPASGEYGDRDDAGYMEYPARASRAEQLLQGCDP